MHCIYVSSVAAHLWVRRSSSRTW